MKTRSNMPLYVVECDNVKTLSNSQIDLLRCGDYLVKKDSSGEHAYKVTYKSDTGMCITYHDASVVETQSYDKVDGNWVYNSEDKTELGGSGTKLYKHVFSVTSFGNNTHTLENVEGVCTLTIGGFSTSVVAFEVITKTSVPYTNLGSVIADEDNIVSIHYNIAGSNKIFNGIVDCDKNNSSLKLAWLDYASSKITIKTYSQASNTSFAGTGDVVTDF